MPEKSIHPAYLGDDFPRDGCLLVVEVNTSGYEVRLFSPGSYPMVHRGRNQGLIDRVTCGTSEQLAHLVTHMATGAPLPADWPVLGYSSGSVKS